VREECGAGVWIFEKKGNFLVWLLIFFNREIKKELGEEGFKKLRRGWDVPIPNGETLKDVYNRTVPYYESEILPKLKDGKNVLVSAHGNSLRALVKYLDGLSDSDVENLEITTGEVIIYKVDTAGSVVSKELRRA